MTNSVTPTPARPPSARAVILGGLLPVLAYTFVEEYFGILWGLVAGMAFGVAEILFEWRRHGKVDAITWGGNGMLLALGGVSLFTSEGIWFKLQPAILEVITAIFLWVTVLRGKPLLVMLSERQGTFAALPPHAVPIIRSKMSGMTARIGVFFALHAALATWAAFHWSTRAWAILKGVGFTVSLLLYMVIEALALRGHLRAPKVSE